MTRQQRPVDEVGIDGLSQDLHAGEEFNSNHDLLPFPAIVKYLMIVRGNGNRKLPCVEPCVLCRPIILCVLIW